MKLQKRDEVGAVTLLIKVKDHRGDPMNEETDIRAGLDRLKEHKETGEGFCNTHNDEAILID